MRNYIVSSRHILLIQIEICFFVFLVCLLCFLFAYLFTPIDFEDKTYF